MTESTGKAPIIDTSQSSAYMYKVTMVVQVIAPNRQIADAKLDQDGGYVSRRDVEFIRSVILYQHEENDAVAEDIKTVSEQFQEEADEDYI